MVLLDTEAETGNVGYSPLRAIKAHEPSRGLKWELRELELGDVTGVDAGDGFATAIHEGFYRCALTTGPVKNHAWEGDRRVLRGR
jgi:hypothetical protein